MKTVALLDIGNQRITIEKWLDDDYKIIQENREFYGFKEVYSETFTTLKPSLEEFVKRINKIIEQE